MPSKNNKSFEWILISSIVVCNKVATEIAAKTLRPIDQADQSIGSLENTLIQKTVPLVRQRSQKPSVSARKFTELWHWIESIEIDVTKLYIRSLILDASPFIPQVFFNLSTSLTLVFPKWMSVFPMGFERSPHGPWFCGKVRTIARSNDNPQGDIVAPKTRQASNPHCVVRSVQPPIEKRRTSRLTL